ncbi:hypothetical protein AB0L85_28420 [Streptomyces sp. NPDC052051]|uniref:hypothetical protein n=1 Tax=Streptomyces sp. NPDC052051 TaxID=3154649 RepID=UPI00344A3627
MIGKLGDKLLGVLLKEDKAGACVPEHGSFCKCSSHKKYIYSCNGPCVVSGTC